MTTVPAPQPEATQADETATEATEVAPLEPTVIPTAAPEPTTITALRPTLAPEPAATETPTPARTATQVPASTQPPRVTLPPAATAVPPAVPTPYTTAGSTLTPTQPASTLGGLTVAPEYRCAPYDPDDYPYSPSVEAKIVDALGGIYGPYTGTWFESIREMDIEHIVARSEAHDSGLCAVSPETQVRIRIRPPEPSRWRLQASTGTRRAPTTPPSGFPTLNECWYVDRTIQVRLEYGLTIDRAEADAIDRVLAGCESTDHGRDHARSLNPYCPDNSNRSNNTHDHH